MAQILSGREAAQAWKSHIRKEVAGRLAQGKRAPHLAAILVGEDPASQAYVKGKVRDCEEVGFASTLITLSEGTSQAELLEHVARLNRNPEVDGFIVQLPLPIHLNPDEVLLAIDPQKDVDGFHPENVGRMALGLPTYLPATPYGMLLLLEHYGISPAGKHAVVVGRSNIVGSPMSILLSRNSKMGNATVTLAHSKTSNLKELCQSADLLVAAIGRPKYVTADMIRPGAVVLDVGINRVDGRLVGDVDFDSAMDVAGAITPVPGGVGLMTRVGLLMNTLHAARHR
ncbi:MAG: bifunctional 5,10-methylenetetrahydrofolate dehydrogenase/5,10-methenyltetrahydrofolate cyclohydrolase [Bacteroidetes bacterium]|nr:bifunctional 5,10-methylenetetrahydrofolate dehydrogenase/5,10-methenyltetrahydrofolate cyclohydrolase [Bacteroidota bacterium]